MTQHNIYIWEKGKRNKLIDGRLFAGLPIHIVLTYEHIDHQEIFTRIPKCRNLTPLIIRARPDVTTAFCKPHEIFATLKDRQHKTLSPSLLCLVNNPAIF